MNAYVKLNKRRGRRLPASLTDLRALRAHGRVLHRLVDWRLRYDSVFRLA